MTIKKGGSIFGYLIIGLIAVVAIITGIILWFIFTPSSFWGIVGFVVLWYVVTCIVCLIIALVGAKLDKN